MKLMKFNYQQDFSNIDFRQHPELYQVGIGEQGVLLVEPYKGEILPYWRFRTPDIARESAEAIYSLYLKYKTEKDFVGMDMARKFIQMGYTRSRRYANHSSGRKWSADHTVVMPQDPTHHDNEKAVSAQLFKVKWDLIRSDPEYQRMLLAHRARYETLAPEGGQPEKGQPQADKSVAAESSSVASQAEPAKTSRRKK